MPQPYRPSVLLIGGGNMGRALLGAWKKNNIISTALVVDPVPHASLASLAEVVVDIDAVQTEFDIIVLAVKPQHTEFIMPKLSRLMNGQTGFVSVVAGKGTGYFLNFLGDNTPIIRAMPNTPCQIQKGITGLFATSSCTDAFKKKVFHLFETVGLSFWLQDENKMHALTAITASGPGFLFYMLEKIEKQQGRDKALDIIESCDASFFDAYYHAASHYQILSDAQLACVIKQLFVGTAQLARHSTEQSFAQLRAAVTSPNGTTQAGLEYLMQANEQPLQETLAATLLAATSRSIELGD